MNFNKKNITKNNVNSRCRNIKQFVLCCKELNKNFEQNLNKTAIFSQLYELEVTELEDTELGIVILREIKSIIFHL